LQLGREIMTKGRIEVVLRRSVGNETDSGYVGKMNESWSERYVVAKRLGEVNYRIRKNDVMVHDRIVCVNVLKAFVEKAELVRQLVICTEKKEQHIGSAEVDPVLADGFGQ